MKLASIPFLIAVVVSTGFAQKDVIPKPSAIEPGTGAFSLTKDTNIVAKGTAGRRSAEVLNDALQKRFGFRLKVTKKSQPNTIVLDDGGYDGGPMGMDDLSVTAEEYVLTVEADRIYIRGREAGRFYAIQSLLQLMPINGSAVLIID